MASEELVDMARKAAALADERDSLMAQLHSSARPRAKKGAFGREKENTAPEFGALTQATNSGAVFSFSRPDANALDELLQEQALNMAFKNTVKVGGVRFSSPLLTPKSNANAKFREGDDLHSAATRSARNSVEAIIQSNMAALVGADPQLDSNTNVLSAFLGEPDNPHLHWQTNKSGAAARQLDEIALENSTLRALVNTKDLELVGLRNKLRESGERTTVLLNELGLSKQAMGDQEGRQLSECKTMLKDVTFELAQAHNQQKDLEADRDKSESSLLHQVSGSVQTPFLCLSVSVG